MDGVTINDNTITGTLKYVTGYTEFNPSEPDEQEGNYLALDFADSFTDGTVTSIQVTHTGGEQKSVTLNSGDSYYVLRVVDPNDVITATPTGSGELQSRTLTLAVTLEPNPSLEANSISTLSNEEVEYTQEQLEAMTVNDIKSLAEEKGYTITKTLKAEIVEEFLQQQQ